MSACARCEALPEPLPESGTLYVAPPLTHTAGTIRRMFQGLGLEVSEPAEGILSMPLAPGVLARLTEEASRGLSQVELKDARALVLAEGAALGFTDLARMQSLASLIAKVRGRWLHEMIREDRLVTHFQPIVLADRPGEVYAHECLIRGLDADGTLVAPGELYQAARAADLMFPLDRAARLRAIRASMENDLRGNLFINFNPTSIYDPAFCLRTTVAAIDTAGIDASRVVFEIVESDEGHPDLEGIVAYYRKAGFRVALDDLGAGFGSLNLMASLRPDFVKLDMHLIRNIDRDPYKADITAKLLEMARKLGVGTVAEGIETEGEYDWVRHHGADYVQGYLFARPSCPPSPPRVPASLSGQLVGSA